MKNFTPSPLKNDTLNEGSLNVVDSKLNHSILSKLIGLFSKSIFIIASLLLLTVASTKLNAQVVYTAARTTGITFSSISSTGTSFTGWRNATSTDDNLSGSTAIGFNFYYDGANRTTFSVSTNGFLTFNTGTTAVGSGLSAYGYSNSNFSTTSGTTQALAPMYDDLVTVGNPGTAAGLASAVKYKLTGTAPNRVLTVEWIGMEVYANAGPNLNFQIKLNETTNKIEYWYGTMTASSATYSYTSGLNGLTVSATPAANELYTQQTANSATFSNVASNSLSTIPATNTKIVFTPQTACSGTPVAGTAAAATSTFCTSGSTTLTLTGYTSGVSGISLQWQNSTDGGTTWNNISGATSNTFTTPTLIATTKYRCAVVCSGSGSTANSNVVTITINTSPTGTISPSSNVSICSPATTATLSVVTASASPTYQWQLNGVAISGATAASYTATTAGNYNVLITSGGCTGTSLTAIVSVRTAPTVTATVSPTTVCEGSPINFSASASTADTTYSVSAIPYSKVLPTGATTILSATGVNNSTGNFTGNMDDGYWSGISLPFTFNYFGSNYTSLAISTNGNVQFGTNLTTTWVISPAPTAGVPDNYIGAPWVDMDHSSTTTGSKIEYFVNGTSPNRQFVINWFAPLFGSSDNDTCQLVLAEGSNNITVNLAAFLNTLHQKTLGIENADGSVATVAPGRNGTYWQTTTNESWLFKRGAVSYAWSGPSSFSSTIQSPSVASVLVANAGTYSVTVTDVNGCSASSTVTANINKAPVITCPGSISVVTPVGSCNAVVTYTATATGIPAPTITYSIASGSTFSVGTTVVTATATNSCGSVSCSFNVTVTGSSTNYWVGGVSTDWFNAANWCSGVPTSSTDVQIPSGAAHMPDISFLGAVCRNMSINSGAALTMNSSGYLTVFGNWTNAGTFTANAGVVNFGGSSIQTITGATTFYGLDVYNAAGVQLSTSSNIKITNEAQLVTGIITTGTSTVSVEAGATIIVTNGYVNGFLKKAIEVGSPSVQTFEIGSATSYLPVSVSFNNVTTAGALTVNSIGTDHPSIATSQFDATRTINRYWNIANSGVAFDYYDLSLTYVAGDKDAGFISMYTGVKMNSTSSVWSALTLNTISSTEVSVGNNTSFGAIQIGVFNPAPVAISVTPDYSYTGQTGNIVFNGKGFIGGATTVNAPAGITINSTTVNNDSTLTLNITTALTAASGTRKFAIKNSLPYGGVSDSLTFTVRKKPVASFFANRTTIACNVSGTVEFVNYTSDGTSYLWNFGAGATPATATGTGPYTVSYSTTGAKTVKLIAFSPIGNDTLTRTNYINVTANAPAVAASITGLTNLCSVGTANVVYNAPLITDVTYNWTVPAGATIISGQGTRTLTVSYGPTFVSGSITVTESNGCGTSAAKSLAVSIAPPAPASLTGTTLICGINSATYTAATVVGATSYTWTLPAGATCSLGASPLTTTSTSITVNFAAAFVSGAITVKANNSCASSVAKSLGVSKAAAAPTAITGPTAICALTTATYSVAAVSGATGYTWTAPAGVTIVSGQGTTSISVTIAANVASGTLKVVSTTACASSGARTLALVGCRSVEMEEAPEPIANASISAVVYPNPSNGEFNIAYTSEIASTLYIQMYDVQGRMVIENTVTIENGENVININQNGIEHGIYFIKLTDKLNQMNETKKLVIR